MNTPWDICRDGKPVAVAIATASEVPSTLESLAAVVGLNPSEAPHWTAVLPPPLATPGEGPPAVRLADGTRKPFADLLPTDVLAPGECLTVPNSVVMVWAGDLGSLGQLVVSWTSEEECLLDLGFHVRRFDWADHRDAEVLEVITGLAGRKELHGLLVTAHGYAQGFGNHARARGDGEEGTVWWDITYQSVYDGTAYRLGLVVINACYSAYRKGDWYRQVDHLFHLGGQGILPYSTWAEECLEERGARDLVADSPAAFFGGNPKIMVPPFETYLVRSCLAPGAQGTRRAQA